MSGAPIGSAKRPKVARKVPARRVASGRRSAVARKRPSREPAVPAILLEGDRPPAPVVSGPGERYVLGPTPPPEPPPTPAEELPEAYGTKSLFLVARDPEWLFAQWDFTRAQQRQANARSADGHMVLRIHLDKLGPAPLLDVHLRPDSRHWFVRVGRGVAAYVAELGYYRRRDRAWQQLAVSEVVWTPGTKGVQTEAAEFATIPAHVPLPELAARVRAAGGAPTMVARALAVPQPPRKAAGVAEAGAAAGPGGQPPATAQAVGATGAARASAGTDGGGEHAGEGVAWQALPAIGPAQGAATSPAGPVTSVSSPFGGPPAAAKGFWFNINAELVVYGATESDATVTIAGRQVKLREDGSFSCRFALPDGSYELTATAVSADGTEARAAKLQFSRATDYHGSVGEAAPPAVQPPPKAPNK